METCRFILYLNLSMATAFSGYPLGLVVAGNIVLSYDMGVPGCNATPTGGIGIHGA